MPRILSVAVVGVDGGGADVRLHVRKHAIVATPPHPESELKRRAIISWGQRLGKFFFYFLGRSGAQLLLFVPQLLCILLQESHTPLLALVLPPQCSPAASLSGLGRVLFLACFCFSQLG